MTPPDRASSSPQATRRGRKESPVNALPHTVTEWRTIVVKAYDDQPTLRLTRPQVQRLWGMDAATCRRVLDELITAGVLAREDGRYCRADVPGPLTPPGTY